MNNKKYNILFIGNSYTYVNDMPHIFKDVAKAHGIEVITAAITNGGWTLERHADINDTYGAATDAILGGAKFDFVVLQEQSLRPSVNPDAFFKAAEILLAKVKANGAVPVLYSTWGRKEGSPILSENLMSSEEMTQKTAASYEKLANKHNIKVAHVGLAFLDVCKKHPEIELYHPDMSHPSKNGSYLAALMLFARIFDTEITASECDCTDPKTAKTLVNAANEMIKSSL